MVEGATTPRGPRNPEIVEATRLHNARIRRERHQTLIEGPHLLADALAAGVRVDTVFVYSRDTPSFELAEQHGLTAIPVSETALERLADTRTPRGPIAIVEIPTHELSGGTNLLVSYGVSEPGNVGALIRTAAGFGWKFAYTPGSGDPWSPKTLRAGAGGHFRTIVAPVSGLADLDSWQTVATVVEGGSSPGTLENGPYALLIGSEAHGLPAEVIEAADSRITVPMPGGIESLNASVAAGILVYALSAR